MGTVILILSNLLKKYWKPALIVALIIGAFLGGRFLAPDKVKTVTQTITVKDTNVSNLNTERKIDTVTKYVDRPVDRIITKTIIKEPSGKVTETSTDSTHQGNLEINKTKDEQKNTQVQVKTEIVYKDRLVEKAVEHSDKKLSLGLSVGYNLTGESTTNYVPGLPQETVVGVYGAYEVFSSVKAGGFLNSRGDAGVMVEVDW